MLDENDTTSETSSSTTTSRPRRRAAGRPAGPPAPVSSDIFASPVAPEPSAPEKKQPQKKQPQKKAASAKSASAKKGAEVPPAKEESTEAPASDESTKPATKSTPRKKSAKKSAPATDRDAAVQGPAEGISVEPAAPTSGVVFQAPEPTVAPARPKRVKDDTADTSSESDRDDDSATDDDADGDGADGDGGPRRRRRSRGGRRRRKPDSEGEGGGQSSNTQSSNAQSENDGGSDDDADDDSGGEGSSSSSRRRRARRRAGDGSGGGSDDPENTVVRVREGRNAADEITGVTGSTRLEAKKQRRREGREAGRRRAPIVSEAEFLARRESVSRQMVVRQHDDYTQIAVMEDKVLVEHYVARESQTSLIGNVYLGKVQNVLPSMEAAFIDIGAGRNAVLYAGEVDWSTLGNGKQRKIEDVLTSGQTVLVQVSKDPVGQKGARLTSQVSLPGRFLVYVPGGQTSGISRKLPENERGRLKSLLKEVLPDNAGVIVRTAAEGATEDQLTRDVAALRARWEDIERKVEAGKAPELLYSEPDLMIKVVRDLFNEDFTSLVVEGTDAWDNISGYVQHVASDLAERLEQWKPEEHEDNHAFSHFRIDEQIHKALERKVWLPSGGSLVIDRTEAMTVVDVNTGKFTGSGGNLEETVTKNNLEAAEEIVRQLRLRDIGGIIVIDFIDMVLENNRDLVLRRLVECLGRDRTRHQVAEVTSLGLVQMTRKRIGTGLLESFSTDCDHCKGRGVQIQDAPVEPKKDEPRRGRQRGGRGGNGQGQGGNGSKGGSGGNGNRGGGQQAKKDQSRAPKAEHEPDDQAAQAPEQSPPPPPEPEATVAQAEPPKADDTVPDVPVAEPEATVAPVEETVGQVEPPKADDTIQDAPAAEVEVPTTEPVLTDEGQAP